MKLRPNKEGQGAFIERQVANARPLSCCPFSYLLAEAVWGAPQAKSRLASSATHTVVIVVDIDAVVVIDVVASAVCSCCCGGFLLFMLLTVILLKLVFDVADSCC